MNALVIKPPVALRTIALFEIFKGGLAVAAGCGLLSLRHTDLLAVTDAFLLRYGINPETHYTRWFIEMVAKVTNHHIAQIAGVCLLYALIRFIEGYGLWHGKSWAEWFAVLSASIYLPMEIRHFFNHTTVISAGITILNFAVIIYLCKLLMCQRAKAHVSRTSAPKLVSENRD